MLKSISSLKGTKILNKKEQQQINGGRVPSCWVACPDQAPIICGLNTGIYTQCDCNCY
ncbi:hypothetical protein [Aquimarina rhabdastrellae]